MGITVGVFGATGYTGIELTRALLALALVVVALDNLLEGAATQVVQNFNLAFGLSEILGLAAEPARLLVLGTSIGSAGSSRPFGWHLRRFRLAHPAAAGPPPAGTVHDPSPRRQTGAWHLRVQPVLLALLEGRCS